MSVEVSDKPGIEQRCGPAGARRAGLLLSEHEQAAVLDLARCMGYSPLKFDSVTNMSSKAKQDRCRKGDVFIDSGLFE